MAALNMTTSDRLHRDSTSCRDLVTTHPHTNSPATPPCADEILPGLFIGNEAAAHSAKVLKSIGVTSILNATTTPHPNSEWVHRWLKSRGGDFLEVPIEDLRSTDLLPHLELCCAFIDRGLKKKEGENSPRGVVLVHCHQGTSRSASIIIAWLMHHFRTTEKFMNLRDALNFVMAHRDRDSPATHPNAGFLVQLGRWEQLCQTKAAALESQRQSSSLSEGVLEGLSRPEISCSPSSFLQFEPSLGLKEYALLAHTTWSGKNRGPCDSELCPCRANKVEGP